MKTLKITTACATLALALSACGSSTEAAKTEEPSASATETSTSKSFTVSSSSASASESAKASASPTASASASASATASSEPANATSGSVTDAAGPDPASIPADMTVSSEKAKTFRPEKLGIYKLDSTTEDPNGGITANYEYFERENPFTFAVLYRPEDNFEVMTTNLEQKVSVGSGICGIFTDTGVSRTISCYFPVTEGGLLKTSSTVFTDDPALMDAHYEYIVRATADLANQIKD